MAVFHYENIPKILTDQPYWLTCKGKIPVGGWKDPTKWLSYSVAVEQAKDNDYNLGFIINKAGIAALDFDNALQKGTNTFLNEEMENFYLSLLKDYPELYVERSLSGEGLHIFLKPTPGKFGTITNKADNVWYFDKDKNIKLEIFYGSNGRQIIVTGVLFNTGCYVPENEEADSLLEKAMLHTASATNPATVTADDKSLNEVQPSVTTGAAEISGYDRDKAKALLNLIDCSSLSRQDWFTATTVVKKYNLYTEWVEWCETDPGRSTSNRDKHENQSVWDSIQDQDNYNLGVLVNIAKAQGCGFDEKTFEQQRTSHNGLSLVDMPTDVFTPEVFFNGDSSDQDNSNRLYRANPDTLRYVLDAQKFATFRYTFIDPETGENWGGFWHIGSLEFVFSMARKLADKMEQQAESKYQLTIARSFKNQKKVTAAVNMLKSNDAIWITQADLDNHPELLNVQNGVVSLETGVLMPAVPALYLTQQAPVVYEPDISSKVFDTFMQQILPDEDTRAAVLRYLGYCLTGDISQHKALFIEGDGGNGKGTLTRTIMTLMGAFATSYPIDALLKSNRKKDSEAATPSRGNLVGRRFVVADELKQDQKLDSAEFKLLTGGDKFPYRKLYSQPMICEHPQHKFVLSGQFLPDIENAHDEGIQRRLLVVKFPMKFTGENADFTLENKLKAPNSMSGILSSLVREAVSYYKEGLLESSVMVERRTKYIEDNSFISEFLETFTETFLGIYIRRQDMLKKIKTEYPSHCSELSDRALTDMIKKARTDSHPQGYEYVRKKGTFCFDNLRWKQD